MFVQSMYGNYEESLNRVPMICS